MIQARHHIFWTWFLNVYVKLRIRFHFREVRFHGDIPTDKSQAILLIANHFSWWDGFVAQYVNLHYLKKRFFVMMLENELRKRRFLSKAGAFSIQPSAKSMLASLDYASEILRNPGNLLLLYPQGKIQSMHQRPICFAKGWSRILERVPTLPRIMLMVVLTDYGSFPKPSLHIHLEEYNPSNGLSSNSIEDAFNTHLINSANMQDI